MGASSKWFRVVRQKFAKKSPQRDIIVVNTASVFQAETDGEEDEENANLLLTVDTPSFLSRNRVLTEEDIAVITIQAHFRGHLARRAFRALRSLVKLQAMVRGARVRKQARIALHCMHAMVRLQVSVRARQLLGRGGDGDLSTSRRLC